MAEASGHDHEDKTGVGIVWVTKTNPALAKLAYFHTGPPEGQSGMFLISSCGSHSTGFFPLQRDFRKDRGVPVQRMADHRHGEIPRLESPCRTNSKGKIVPSLWPSVLSKAQ